MNSYSESNKTGCLLRNILVKPLT